MNRSSTSILFLACIQLLWGGPSASAQSTPTLNEIQQAWKARQDRIRSATFEWTETRLIPKHTMPTAGFLSAKHSQSPGGSPKQAAKGEALPAEDLSLECLKTLSLNGTMMRYSREGHYWDPVQSRVLPISYLATCDGEVGKSLFAIKERAPIPPPFLGYIEKSARHADWDNEELLPILLTARPCIVDMGGRDLSGFAVSPKLGTIDGHECVVLTQEPKPKLRHLETLWLDSRRGFIVARAVRSQKGLDRTFDISYQEDPSGGWLPTTWKWVSMGKGRTTGQLVVQVTKREVNADIPQSEFQLDFPVGAQVHDLRPGAAPGKYIVRAGAEKREITKAELRRGATYDQLVSTESGMAALPGNWTRWIAVAIGLVVLALIVCAFVFRRRHAPAVKSNS